MLNSNIRCIEIKYRKEVVWQTEKLNSNIRCIEMFQTRITYNEERRLNSNIRCIEMFRPLTVKFVGDVE